MLCIFMFAFHRRPFHPFYAPGGRLTASATATCLAHDFDLKVEPHEGANGQSQNTHGAGKSSREQPKCQSFYFR